MIDDMLIGPVILDDLMIGQNYLDFLQNELPKQLKDFLLVTRISMYFQHDGAHSHYTWHVMQHLNDTFPNRGSVVAVLLTGHQDIQKEPR